MIPLEHAVLFIAMAFIAGISLGVAVCAWTEFIRMRREQPELASNYPLTTSNMIYLPKKPIKSHPKKKTDKITSLPPCR